MRRTDRDGHVMRQGSPPFRVLAVPDHVYLSPVPPAEPPPPPPRAPEPYKVVPSSTSFARAHRRSSFVILAESTTVTPEPRCPSPAGRVSPFRGRGFKGPPPRSKSRSQSPEIHEAGRRRVRVERRVSLSQHSSPRRSLIPQPTYRQRSTSLTKTNDDGSPKANRRVDSKTRLNRADSQGRLNAINSKTRLNSRSDTTKNRTNLTEPRIRFISNSTSNLYNSPTRRQSIKGSTTQLSPIQGTPTKVDRTSITQSIKTGRTKNLTSRTSNTTSKPPPRGSPQKNSVVSRKDSHPDKNSSNSNSSSSKERIVSPSKIPLKASKNNGQQLSSNTGGRFITMTDENSKKESRRVFNENMNNNNNNNKRTDQPVQNGRMSNEPNPREITDSSDDVDLLDLVMQSSHVAGTSSERLVNTTTTTAVQPLQIDTNATIAANQPKDRSDVSNKSSSTVSSMSRNDSPVVVSAQHVLTSEKLAEKGGLSSKVKDQVSRNETKDLTNVTDKTGGQSTKSGGQTNSEDLSNNACAVNNDQHAVNRASANQRSARNNTRAKLSDPEDSSKSTSMLSMEMKSDSASVTRTVANHETTTNDKMPMESNSKIKDKTNDEIKLKTAPTTMTTLTNGTTTNDTIMVNSMTRNNRNVNHNVIDARVNSGTVRGTMNEIRDSDSDSVESIRSTDTGVSVNTVKGLSSPREKTGIHVVKQPQEIETLSGNVVRFEQNGEPVVLAASNEKQNANERLLVRWRRSLNRYCKCCSGMRCLACRRDPKGTLFGIKKPGKKTVSSIDAPQSTAAAATNASSAPKNKFSCWPKLKTRCRCARLREIKCCTRKSRVAPAESATACCPPERRFGAICRRLIGCCSCKRANAQSRTTRKNIRAKHSLTSVVPPVLTEDSRPKIPDVLVEHNSLMRGAIPCLPLPLAWFCLVWNVLLPGSGTIWSGLFNLCTGQPRFAAVATMKSRVGAFIVDLVVGVGQFFTVLFCLVGWGWSIWWGVMMIRLARKYKRLRDSEAASRDPEARGGRSTGAAPGVPSQALRGVERAR